MTRLMKMFCLLVMGAMPFVLVTSTGAVLSGCEPEGGGTGGGGKKDGGADGGGEFQAFNLYDLDVNAREQVYFAMAVDPGTERVGVVYYTPSSSMQMVAGGDGGYEKNYDLKYVEWQGGTASTPEKIRSMQRMVGVSLAFDPIKHEPVAAFLGGAPGFIEGESIYWYQNDSSVARRTGGLWVETAIATVSAMPACSPIDTGFLQGLWPSIVFDSTGKMFVAFRDGHNGQFPQQDWAASDVELLEGASETSLTRRCLTGDHKQAYGGRIQLALGINQRPAIVYDQAFGGADVTGQNVLFQQQNTADLNWGSNAALLTISNTMSGASLAFDATEGYGIAVTDRGTSQLKYIKSANGAAWSVPDDVFGSGTGGWYPSLAMDPVNHEPAIAFYVCSARADIADTACLQTDDELRVTQRIIGNWRETTVDTGGGWQPKLSFFASGKRVVAYRVPASLDSTAKTNPNAGVIRLAVEK